ncbi:MAG: ribonuclease III [Acidobacteriota bacterium]|nr:ribonuclease III [Blastocatellia bacterium]MDW8412053.1 ribonuclease III [Acidobacteriota bacterium]
MEDYSELERKLGYSFQLQELLERALLHRSWTYENGGTSNETLEFLGDATLGFIVSKWLFETYPSLDEGKLSKIKAYLVSARVLARRAEALSIGKFVKLSKGEEKTGGRNKRTILSDTYEAIIAAIYLDGGLEAATKFVRSELQQELLNLKVEDLSVTDFKSALQEYLQAQGLPPPEYAVVEKKGPDHNRTFYVELRVKDERIALGHGSSIKLAQEEAAREALTKLKSTG